MKNIRIISPGVGRMFEHLRDFCVWPQPLVIQKISKFICVLCLLIEYTLLLWHSRQKMLSQQAKQENLFAICIYL